MADARFRATDLYIPGLMTCSECGALVKSTRTELHQAHHANISQPQDLAWKKAADKQISDLQAQVKEMRTALEEMGADVSRIVRYGTERSGAADQEHRVKEDALLPLPEVAELMRTSEATLRWLRNQRRADFLFKSGRRLVAWRSDVLAHLDAERSADGGDQ